MSFGDSEPAPEAERPNPRTAEPAASEPVGAGHASPSRGGRARIRASEPTSLNPRRLRNSKFRLLAMSRLRRQLMAEERLQKILATPAWHPAPRGGIDTEGRVWVNGAAVTELAPKPTGTRPHQGGWQAAARAQALGLPGAVQAGQHVTTMSDRSARHGDGSAARGEGTRLPGRRLITTARAAAAHQRWRNGQRIMSATTHLPKHTGEG